MLSMDDVRRLLLEDGSEAISGVGERERIAGSGRRADGGESMDVGGVGLIVGVRGSDDVDIVSERLQLAGEGGDRDHDSVYDWSIALGEEGDSHELDGPVL
jgi:hypothetical protein